MQKFSTLDDAIALATFAHRNQKDKAGLDYINHPVRVLNKVQAQGAMPYVQMAAILHDVTEDSTLTVDILSQLGFSEAVVQLIALLDRNHSQLMWERIGRKSVSSPTDYYYLKIKEKAGAKMIKLADIEDNLSPWRLSYLSEDTQARLQAKYAHAKEILGA